MSGRKRRDAQMERVRASTNYAAEMRLRPGDRRVDAVYDAHQQMKALKVLLKQALDRQEGQATAQLLAQIEAVDPEVLAPNWREWRREVVSWRWKFPIVKTAAVPRRIGEQARMRVMNGELRALAVRSLEVR